MQERCSLFVPALCYDQTVNASRTARERVRAELTREITEVARSQLATEGAGGLSLRAVARDMGMVSSAIYRYFPSRDDLLTALIVDGYNAIGEVAEQADTAVPAGDYTGRWLAVCRAVRDWALAHPHEYALVYGSPVPGYQAPQQTIGPGRPGGHGLRHDHQPGLPGRCAAAAGGRPGRPGAAAGGRRRAARVDHAGCPR